MFLVECHDNDTTAFEDSDAERCPKCNELLDKWREPLVGLVIAKRRLDLSTTYDGVTIASPRFIEVYRAQRMVGLKFLALPDDPGFFQLQATKTLKVDARAAGVEFENRCPKCKRWESVIGADPVVFARGAKVAPLGFARSDLEFASNDEKCPLFVCGDKAAAALKAAKLKGMVLEEID